MYSAEPKMVKTDFRRADLLGLLFIAKLLLSNNYNYWKAQTMIVQFDKLAR